MTTPRDVSKVIEVKVLAGFAATLVASVVVALLQAVAANPSVLLGLPPWASFVITTSIPPVLGCLAGYVMPSNRVPPPPE